MTKNQRKGVTLGEAVQEYADPRRLEESDQYGGYDRGWRSRPPAYVFFIDGLLPPEANTTDRRERLWVDMEEDLWRLLENGKLVLWGYWCPLERTSRRERVAPHLIPLLKPNFEISTAEGGGLSLENARVYPVGVVPEDVKTGDKAPEIPSEARPAAAPIADEVFEDEAKTWGLSKRRRRPSRGDEIGAAFRRLDARGKVDRGKPLTAVIGPVRDEVMEKAGNRRREGLAGATIRKHIVDEFKAGKASGSSSHNL